jgi:hypothetical protein
VEWPRLVCPNTQKDIGREQPPEKHDL